GAVLGNAQRALDAAGGCTRHVTGHAVDLRIVVCFDDHLVIRADPLEYRVDLADLLGVRTAAPCECAACERAGGDGAAPAVTTHGDLLFDSSDAAESRRSSSGSTSDRASTRAPMCASVRKDPTSLRCRNIVCGDGTRNSPWRMPRSKPIARARDGRSDAAKS